MTDDLNRQTFSTGATRGTDCDDARYDLIPLVGLRRLARTCAEGAIKHGIDNWLKGIPSENLMNHAVTHLCDYLDGDRSEDHIAHAVWNLFALMHNEERRADMHGRYAVEPVIPTMMTFIEKDRISPEAAPEPAPEPEKAPETDEPPPPRIHLGRVIRDLRRRLGLTQAAFANATWVSLPCIVDAEEGKPVPPGLLRRIRETFGVDVHMYAWAAHGDAGALPPCLASIAKDLKDAWSIRVDRIVEQRLAERKTQGA